MIQLIPFNQSRGGTTPNMCLANVIKGYVIGAKYPDAWTAWVNTQQHGGDAPAGLDVPVFFSYVATIDGVNKNWGHIGVRLANGQFWSDGKVYPTIAAYTSNHAPKYVGWGESINNVKVIGVEEMQPLTPAQVDHVLKMGLQREPTPEELNNPDYHANAGLLIDTVWNNGGEENYKNRNTQYIPAGQLFIKK